MPVILSWRQRLFFGSWQNLFHCSMIFSKCGSKWFRNTVFLTQTSNIAYLSPAQQTRISQAPCPEDEHTSCSKFYEIHYIINQSYIQGVSFITARSTVAPSRRKCLPPPGHLVSAGGLTTAIKATHCTRRHGVTSQTTAVVSYLSWTSSGLGHCPDPEQLCSQRLRDVHFQD